MKPAALREAIMSTDGRVVETDFYGDIIPKQKPPRLSLVDAKPLDDRDPEEEETP